jgi:hypothetical protein
MMISIFIPRIEIDYPCPSTYPARQLPMKYLEKPEKCSSFLLNYFKLCLEIANPFPSGNMISYSGLRLEKKSAIQPNN